MSHVYAYGQQCPNAKGIIHLGATSCFVGDNTDLIVMYEALELVKKKLVNVLAELKKFALDYKDLPVLAFTHFQPAQPTTLGKMCIRDSNIVNSLYGKIIFPIVVISL